MSEVPTAPQDHCETAAYEISLRGHLDAHWAETFGVSGLTNNSDGTTTLRVVAADQAALHGVLQRVRDLGLTLVSVVRLPCDPE